MPDRAKRVFAYGTLLRGGSNHERFCADALAIEPASTTGRLYDLLAGFPAMVSAAFGTVYGEAMTFPDIAEALAGLDCLDGYRRERPEHSLYLRRVQNVTLLDSGATVPAYCYVWRGLLPEGAVLVRSGRWTPNTARESSEFPP